MPHSTGYFSTNVIQKQGSNNDLETQRMLPEEAPIAMSFNGNSYAVMMATPLDIEDFALGFALTEGIIAHKNDIESINILSHDEAGMEAQIWLKEEKADALAARRRTMAGPVGCGLCGIESLEAATRSLPKITTHKDAYFSLDEVCAATSLLRAFQPLHDLTHGVHAAGFMLPNKGIILAREDVGRHNALDKLIGALHQKEEVLQTLQKGALVLTSRLSMEMVQKAAIAGIGVVIAVSTPTSYALKLAREANLTLIANAKGNKCDIFTHDFRIKGKIK